MQYGVGHPGLQSPAYNPYATSQATKSADFNELIVLHCRRLRHRVNMDTSRRANVLAGVDHEEDNLGRSEGNELRTTLEVLMEECSDLFDSVGLRGMVTTRSTQ